MQQRQPEGLYCLAAQTCMRLAGRCQACWFILHMSTGEVGSGCAGARRLGQDGKDIADPAFPPGSVGVNIEKLSAAEQRQRAELVGEPAQRERAVCFGVTGQSQLYRLPYVDANNVWLFAPSHTAVLGPLKDFWRHLLEAWTREGEICESASC